MKIKTRCSLCGSEFEIDHRTSLFEEQPRKYINYFHYHKRPNGQWCESNSVRGPETRESHVQRNDSTP